MATQDKKSSKPASEYLPELMLDTKIEKYKLIPAVIRWVVEVKKKEENKDIPHMQLIDIALKEILKGDVSLETINKLPPLQEPKKTSGAKNDRQKRY